MGRPHRWKASAFRRLNSFGTVRHHRDVILFLFTNGSPFVAAVHLQFRGNKKPRLLGGKQGLEILVRFVTCLPPDYPNSLRGFAHDMTWIGQGQTHSPELTGYDVSLSRPTSSA